MSLMPPMVPGMPMPHAFPNGMVPMPGVAPQPNQDTPKPKSFDPMAAAFAAQKNKLKGNTFNEQVTKSSKGW